MPGLMQGHEGLYEELGNCVLCLCDASGRRLLEGSPSLARLLGVGLGELYTSWYPLLTRGGAELYLSLLAPEGAAGALLPYVHPSTGMRWLFLRFAPEEPGTDGRVLFLRDETPPEHGQYRSIPTCASDSDATTFECGAQTLAGEGGARTFFDILHSGPEGFDFVLGEVESQRPKADSLRPLIKQAFDECGPGLDRRGDLPEAPSPALVCAAVESRILKRFLLDGARLSLSYARFDARNRSLVYSTCGPTPIGHFTKRSGSSWRIVGSRPTIGSGAAQDFPTYYLPVDSGDAVLFYTSGTVEERNRFGQSLGDRGLLNLLGMHAESSAPKIVDALILGGYGYSGGRLTKDHCLVCVKDDRPESHKRVDRFIELKLGPADGKGLDEAETRLEEDLRLFGPGLGEEGLIEVRIACHEALGNIFVHALPLGGGSCDFRWWIVPDLVFVEIEYRGPEYAWYGPQSIPQDRFAQSGYGLPLMDKAMDSIVVAYGPEDRKRLIMARRLRPRTEASPS